MPFCEQDHLSPVPRKPRIIYAGEPKDYILWDNNKGTLRRLYLDQNGTLEDVKQLMETEHQFPILPLKEYETVLRDHFQFRKKVGRADWGPIGHRIEKRKLAGKASHVYLGPKLLPPRSVAREVRRYNSKKAILSRIRQGLSPPLPENIIIRTPSPQPPQYVTTMNFDHTLNICDSILANHTTEYATRVSRDFVIFDISTLADKHARLEAINAIKLLSPFNGFLTLLHRLMSPTPNTEYPTGTRSVPSSYSAPVETGVLAHPTRRPVDRDDSESLVTPTNANVETLSDPSQLVFPGGTIPPTMLAQAWFKVSNGKDWSFTFTDEILEWLKISAEPSDLERLFSIESYTVTAIWENLLNSTIRMNQKGAFELLVDSALSTGRYQWIARYSGEILNMAVKRRMLHTVQRLLTFGISPDSLGYEYDSKVKGTPLQFAAATLQPDMIRILCYHGADVNLRLINFSLASYTVWTDAPLIALLEASDGPHKVYCALILLARGAQVDTCRNFVTSYHDHLPEIEDSGISSWFSPAGPFWCTDYAWHLRHINKELVHILLKHSRRAQEQVTVPGITIQARKGLKNLGHYLTERQFPLITQDRTALLEIALIQAAKNNDFDALTCLLQFGVDPNIGTISGSFKHDKVQYWQPSHQAFLSGHHHLVSILENYGATFTITITITRPTTYELIKSALVHHEHNQLHSVDFSDSDIETHGESLLQLFLRHADQENFPVCASMCDFFWSKGVPKDIKWISGRDSLHFAISQNCSIDMCHFLISRGYEVHSCPVDENPYSTTMLGDAIQNYFAKNQRGSAKVIDFILERGASLEFPPARPTLLESVLQLNANRGSLRVGVRRLFEKFMALGAPVNAPPRTAGTFTWPSVLCRLISLEADDELIFRVMSDSEDIDQQGNPLAMALRYRRAAVTESLLLRGAKVNHPPRPFFRGVLQEACSPDWSADLQKDLSIHVHLIERLISLGADVVGSAGLALGFPTPLQCAASAGLVEVACLLLKHGADVNGLVWGLEKPMRALDYAAEQGRLDMVHLLRRSGGISGDPGETGVDGAISLAEVEGYYSISDFLRSTTDRSNT